MSYVLNGMDDWKPIDYASGDHYEVLGVRRTATENDITKAYKAMARQYHPDKNPQRKQEAEVSFKRIAEAYAVLRDPGRRYDYDQNGNSSYVSYDEAERMWQKFCYSARDLDAFCTSATRNFDERLNRSSGRMPFTGQDEHPRQRPTKYLCLLLFLFVAHRMTSWLLPCLIAVLASFLVLSLCHASNFRRRAWSGVSIVLLLYISHWKQTRQDLGQRSSHVDFGGAALLPRSGEEVLQFDGTFSRTACSDWGADENWQSLLVGSLQTALNEGRQQVSVMFSRQGCPWCDRQLVVFHQIMQRRAGEISESGRETVTSLAEVDSRGSLVLEPSDLRHAALRLFVIDGGEFPEMMAEFKIQAFPTTLVFGGSGITPSMAKGFVDDVALESMLHEVSLKLGPQIQTGGSQGALRARRNESP
mmetsp:Transcript_41797/g.110650  ORF Transcript_41797/g.110650 Transcript_41797/m.110650 type:complete len:417 (-) Transcript_41797:458-1708(-)